MTSVDGKYVGYCLQGMLTNWIIDIDILRIHYAHSVPNLY